VGVPKLPKLGLPTTLGPHNFASRPPMEMMFEAKL